MDRPWTKLEERRAVELRRQRHTLAAVARALGRTYGAVSRKLFKLGATRRQGARRRPGAFLRAVARLSRPGRSDGETAAALGCTVQRVWRARKRLGIPPGLTYAQAGARPKPPPVRCWCCDRKRPTQRAKGWVTRPVGRTCLGLREVYCPACFRAWEWPR